VDARRAGKITIACAMVVCLSIRWVAHKENALVRCKVPAEQPSSFSVYVVPYQSDSHSQSFWSK